MTDHLHASLNAERPGRLSHLHPTRSSSATAGETLSAELFSYLISIEAPPENLPFFYTMKHGDTTDTTDTIDTNFIWPLEGDVNILFKTHIQKRKRVDVFY